ncbi:hypothetical protein [Lacinutrix sp. MedPE-SW]|uniref:hypothetical protein n=1 Tax=Lacinutrix sp. MedPE-SW TaxID=1860087 RepID=UPI000922A07F|nr:hypothetical protein [Lacinutrix sp. MedPE-SW]OIQ22391.1 MAG: hypothetical protein BM549_07815 [Lacinutrix sp. MedPE-SW]
MKLQLHYKIFLLFMLLPLVMVANNGKGKYKKEKTINKTFNVSKNATLRVDNSYGNLDIVTWNENKIVFEIKIITSGNDEEKVAKKLNEITIDFSGEGDYISAKTRFNKEKNKSWWSSWTSNNSNVNMEINYIVKMPITGNVDLSNDYGSINLATLEGKAILDCDYGKITTKELLADNNEISFDYSNNCYFEYIKSGKIDADYSGFTVSKTENLDINADYTKSKIEIAENISYNCDYGGVTIEKANNVKGNGDYLTLRLGDIYKSISINADYGSIRVDKLQKSFENLYIDSDYVGIKIGYDPLLAFNFDIDLEYASLKDEDAFEFIKKREQSSGKYYSGYHKTENSKSTVKINSDYGSVSFYKN